MCQLGIYNQIILSLLEWLYNSDKRTPRYCSGAAAWFVKSLLKTLGLRAWLHETGWLARSAEMCSARYYIGRASLGWAGRGANVFGGKSLFSKWLPQWECIEWLYSYYFSTLVRYFPCFCSFTVCCTSIHCIERELAIRISASSALRHLGLQKCGICARVMYYSLASCWPTKTGWPGENDYMEKIQPGYLWILVTRSRDPSLPSWPSSHVIRRGVDFQSSRDLGRPGQLT